MSQQLQATLRSAAEGDPQAWRTLVEAYSSRVYGLIFRQTGRGDLAEEITQATFVQVVEKLPAYQEQGKFEAWLFRVAINLLRDEQRRNMRQPKAADPEAMAEQWMAKGEDGPVQTLLTGERQEMIRQAVSQLPEADRQILHLRYTADLGYSEIAEILQEPLGTVLARGHRALKKLKEKLEGSEANPRP